MEKQALKVLVADDNLVNLESISDLLEEEGLSYLTATNGVEALKILEEQGPVEVIILDWMMPQMSGFELLKILKRDPRWCDIPVIMQTAKSQEKDMIDALDSKVFLYLTKPYSDKVLASMVRRALSEYRRFKDMERRSEFKQEEAKELLKSLVANQTKKIEFDLKTYQELNQFFIHSLACNDLEALVQTFLDCITKFSFESARNEGEPEEFKLLRCSIRLADGEEINLSDRGISSKLDSMILDKAIKSGEIIARGSYTAVPAASQNLAILIRNSPSNPDELDMALKMVAVMLEMFDARVGHFRDNLEILKQKEALEQKNGHIRNIIKSAAEELGKVNQKYQAMKETQMDIMERLDENLKSVIPNLSEEQLKALEAASIDRLNASMQLYTEDQITDQQFLLTIQELNHLFSEKNAEENKLKPGQLGGTDQAQVDDLLASFGF